MLLIQHIKDAMQSLSRAILSFLSQFAILFSRPAWNNALILLVGILCRGKRTVCAALRVMGLSNETSIAKYHHILNRVQWSSLLASKRLLFMHVSVIGTEYPFVMFIDETQGGLSCPASVCFCTSERTRRQKTCS